MTRNIIGSLLLPIMIANRFLVVAPSALAEPFNLFSSVQGSADEVVKQLRELPTPLPGMARSDGTIPRIEQRRRELYRQLRQLGDDALPALARGLSDPDVRIRRNVALVLNVLAGGWFDSSQPKVNIRVCLRALVAALKDSDASVRGWAAQAIGEIGPDAAEAIPALVTLLRLRGFRQEPVHRRPDSDWARAGAFHRKETALTRCECDLLQHVRAGERDC